MGDSERNRVRGDRKKERDREGQGGTLGQRKTERDLNIERERNGLGE